MSEEGIASNGNTPVTQQQCLTRHDRTNTSIKWLRWILTVILLVMLGNGVLNVTAMLGVSDVRADQKTLDVKVDTRQAGLDGRLERMEKQLDRIEERVRTK